MAVNNTGRSSISVGFYTVQSAQRIKIFLPPPTGLHAMHSPPTKEENPNRFSHNSRYSVVNCSTKLFQTSTCIFTFKKPNRLARVQPERNRIFCAAFRKGLTFLRCLEIVHTLLIPQMFYEDILPINPSPQTPKNWVSANAKSANSAVAARGVINFLGFSRRKYSVIKMGIYCTTPTEFPYFCKERK